MTIDYFVIAVFVVVFVCGILAPKVREEAKKEAEKDPAKDPTERFVENPITKELVAEPKFREVIGGLVYDTEKATCLGVEVKEGRIVWFIYRTKNGRYFLCHRDGDSIISSTERQAKDCLYRASPEVALKWFPDFVPKDA